MISEKLLLEVLDYPNGIVNFGLHGNEVMVLSTTACHDDIYNIYELANLCKVWAHKQGVNTLLSGIDTANKVPTYFAHLPEYINSYDEEMFFKSDNEPDAIFKACEYVLNLRKGI